MSVSGNARYSPFPETLGSNVDRSTERVRRYRATRTTIRVEVEVPSPDDALAVKRFAKQRRAAPVQTSPTITTNPPDSETLATVIDQLTPAARAAVEIFAHALAAATDHELIERAGRVAANYADAVKRSSHGRRVAA